jgi:hypothetical protein
MMDKKFRIHLNGKYNVLFNTGTDMINEKILQSLQENFAIQNFSKIFFTLAAKMWGMKFFKTLYCEIFFQTCTVHTGIKVFI